ncbi:tetratricopeptide repeat protein [Lentzea sp. NPDC060358]|uniref:tetratricopeptide repeat protein n=1 Tax=Lentzea sp. NPDC060358 TaxID=3347103 RepID=UPI00365005DC
MSDPRPAGRSEMSGIAGNVVQAGDVHGGVHVHQAASSDEGVPQQLPAEVSGFVNRVAEMGQLDQLLESRTRKSPPLVVLLCGTAGVGKTSLAVQWAHRVSELFPDGQLYINLRGYDPGAPVAPEEALNLFLRALGVGAGAIPPDLEGKSSWYRSKLATRRVLVLLDNAAEAKQIRPLLPGKGSSLVLVTSRKHMQGLLSRDGAHRVKVDVLTDGEAVVLLRNLVSGHRGEDDVQDLNELSQLCARLPLALRIAAERAAARPWMALSELIRDLRDESVLWEALSSADGDEADAVRTVFAWSYRALPQEAARFFRRLGLHPGAEFGLGTAAALAGLDITTAGRVLHVLVAGHLLEPTTEQNRYRLHDLLRAYANDQVRLEETPEDERAATHRMLTWYLHSAHEAHLAFTRGHRHLPIEVDEGEPLSAPGAFTDRDQVLGWYTTERANLIDAVKVAASSGFDRIAWRIPGLLAVIYDSNDAADMWLDAEQIALESARRAGERYGEGVVLDRLGIKFRRMRRFEEALAHFREALEAFNDLGVELGRVRAVNGMGVVYLEAGRLEEARAAFEQAIAAAANDEETSLRALSTVNLGEVHLKLGSPAETLRCVESAMPALRWFDDVVVELAALRLRGAAQRELGLLAEARTSLRDAVELMVRAGNLSGECYVLLEVARLEIAEGAPKAALETARSAIVLARKFGATTVEEEALDVTGIALQRLDRHEESADFHRTTRTMRGERGPA